MIKIWEYEIQGRLDHLMIDCVSYLPTKFSSYTKIRKYIYEKYQVIRIFYKKMWEKIDHVYINIYDPFNCWITSTTCIDQGLKKSWSSDISRYIILINICTEYVDYSFDLLDFFDIVWSLWITNLYMSDNREI